MMWIAWIATIVCSAWILVGAGAVLRASRRRSVRVDDPAPITVLKPLCGADLNLEGNLRSFFEQDHPNYQLVFGVEDPADASLPVVEALMESYPHADAIIVIHAGVGALNPKVANLRGMLPAAKHDLVLISDTSVRAPRCYLSELAATVAEEGVGLVTNVFVGVGEASLGAALENVQLNGFVVTGSVLPTLAGDACVVGKSMMFSRTAFERLGGFESVRDLLAEDFMIGKMFQHAGHRVRIAPTILESVNGSGDLRSSLRRQLRWSMLRIRLRAAAFVFEPITNPFALLVLAWTLFGPWAVLWMFGLQIARDVVPWIAMRGLRRVWIPILLAPVRDVLMLGVWAVTPFVKHVQWRGHRVRVGAGTHVFLADVVP